MAEVEREGLAVRKNMERLRALRLAKEAEVATSEPAPKTRAKKKAVSKS